ncbi:MAG: XRE family transcriptional regulator [Propionibacteriaceae bacterium]|jgi:Zn-dependent peptidase ImmA (M78 family)/transcriptional regulator with XRE-family HTH domain|nr:XRE family transcriptional regulator [Propionibacteriaceae bacterium]
MATNAQDASRLFDGSRLTLARNLAGLRKNQLADLVDKSATAVTGWEQGSKRPTATNVAALSLALGVEPGFFITGSPDLRQGDALPHFRSLRSTSQLQRDQAGAYGTLAMEVAWGLERHAEFPDVDVPSFPVPDDEDSAEPEEAAHAVRKAWRLGDGPIRHMIRELENHGVLVVFSPPKTASLDAFSIQGIQRPMVVLNPTKNDYYRQRFDVAHELGHLVMHADADPGSRLVEAQANRFAAELLAPADSIRDSLPTTINAAAWGTFMTLKEEWCMSIQALLMRARVLDRLNEVSYRNAMMTLSSRGWRRTEPGQMTVLEQPSMLPRAVELLLGSGMDESLLAGQGHVPVELFGIITSRTPGKLQDGDPDPDENKRLVVSLFPTKASADDAAAVGTEPIQLTQERR